MSEPLRLACARGEARLVSWTMDGTLVDGTSLAAAWQITPAELEETRARGEIFALWVEGKAWYPAEALQIDRGILAAINGALGEASAVSRLLFLLHRHGALQDRTPAEAIKAGLSTDVLRISEVWSTS